MLHYLQENVKDLYICKNYNHESIRIGPWIKSKEFGLGVVTNVTSKHYWVTFIENELETIDIDSEFETIDAVDGEEDSVSFNDMKKLLKSILQKWSDISQVIPIADKWKAGKIVLEPGTMTQNKEIPIDTFFNKLIMVRDRFWVMELKINASNLEQTNKLKCNNTSQDITEV